jgi:hypothetical protein
MVPSSRTPEGCLHDHSPISTTSTHYVSRSNSILYEDPATESVDLITGSAGPGTAVAAARRARAGAPGAPRPRSATSPCAAVLGRHLPAVHRPPARRRVRLAPHARHPRRRLPVPAVCRDPAWDHCHGGRAASPGVPKLPGRADLARPVPRRHRPRNIWKRPSGTVSAAAHADASRGPGTWNSLMGHTAGRPSGTAPADSSRCPPSVMPSSPLACLRCLLPEQQAYDTAPFGELVQQPHIVTPLGEPRGPLCMATLWRWPGQTASCSPACGTAVFRRLSWGSGCHLYRFLRHALAVRVSQVHLSQPGRSPTGGGS